MREINILDVIINDFTEKIGLNPNDAETYYKRGQAYDNQGKHNAALMDFSMTIKLKPNYVDAYIGRAICYKNLGLYEEAISDYNEVIRLNPDYIGLAILYGFRTKTIVVDIS